MKELLSTSNFLTQLRQSAKNTGSIICMGHDPVLEALPKEREKQGIYGYVQFMEVVLKALKKSKQNPGMFKPNLAWWLCYDKPFANDYTGSEALVCLIGIMRDLFKEVPITLDNKTGDIGTSSAKWAQYGLKNWQADAVTVHTYMGSDSIGPFAEYCNAEKKKGAYLLVKTTNKGASDLQLKKMADGQFVYEQTAENVINWAVGKPGVGAVTAGNSPEDLMTLGKIFAGRNIPLLIPGVGPSQGGDAGQVANILRESGYELPLARINLSSAFFSWYKPGKENPSTNECADIIVETMRSLNEKVGLIY